MIRVEKLGKYYGGQKAIADISFSIEAGEVVGLLGLNGAGKSTILKILGTFLMPSAGRAFIDGFSVEEDAYQVRRTIGYLPDVPPLYDEMSVRKYLHYVATIKEVSRGDVASFADEAIGKTNLTEVADSAISTLSHGFRQRVGIAQAIVHKPKVLILDEPINGLDPVQIVEMRDLILSLRKQHTVILSSHILSEITQTCDRIMIIDHGRLVAEGSETDLQTRMSRAFRLECEVGKASSVIVAKLRAIGGVSNVTHNSRAGGTDLLAVEMDHDVRADVARTLVESGADLLAMTRKGEGLEGLFMKFVQS